MTCIFSRKNSSMQTFVSYIKSVVTIILGITLDVVNDLSVFRRKLVLIIHSVRDFFTICEAGLDFFFKFPKFP